MKKAKILFVIIAAVFMAMILQSCASSKYNGCPSTNERKLHKFDNRPFRN